MFRVPVGPARGRTARRLLLPAAGVALAVVLSACTGTDEPASSNAGKASGSPSTSASAGTSTATAGKASTRVPSRTRTTTPSASPSRTRSATPTPTPTPERTGYDRGECLSGRITTDGGEQEELDPVSCSSSKADFKVLRVVPYINGSAQCENVRGSRYAYSKYWTRNGVPLYGSTYCLSVM